MTPADAAIAPTQEVDPIYVVTFIVELPFDLGLRENVGGLLFEDRGTEWATWPEDAIRTVIQLPERYEFTPDLGPGTRWMLRRGWVRTHPQLLVADEVFSDWVVPLLPKRVRKRRRRELRRWRRGIGKPVTVAALSRFVGPEDLPDGPSDERAVQLYERARADFNRVLGLLGLTTGVWWIGPVTDRELANIVPVITELAGPQPEPKEGREPPRRGTTFPMVIHDMHPNIADVEIVNEEQWERTAQLLHAFNAGELSFLPVFELLHQAGGDLNVGKPAHAVVLSAAAVELTVSLLIREGGPLRGWDDERIERALRSPFKNRVEDHLGPLLELTIDLDRGGAAWAAWWRSGYAARNRFVHEARMPTRDEAFEAWTSVHNLLREVRATVDGHAALSPLLDHMPFELRNSGVD